MVSAETLETGLASVEYYVQSLMVPVAIYGRFFRLCEMFRWERFIIIA